MAARWWLRQQRPRASVRVRAPYPSNVSRSTTRLDSRPGPRYQQLAETLDPNLTFSYLQLSLRGCMMPVPQQSPVHVAQPPFLPHGAVLVDASTIHHLLSHTVYHSLTGDYLSRPGIGEILYGILRKQASGAALANRERADASALNHALSFLEHWVLAEEMFVDVDALKSLETEGHSQDKLRKLATLFQKTLIPQEQKIAAARTVDAFFDYIDQDVIPLAGIPNSLMDDYDVYIKDSYFQSFSGSLSVSGNTRARSVFYLELSRLLSAPLFLHPCKSRYLKAIGQAFQQSAFAAYRHLAKQVRLKLSYQSHELPIPPLADEIVRVAREQQVSLLDAATQVRGRDDLASLRRLLVNLWPTAIDGGTVATREQIAREASHIVRRIQSRLRSKSRISRRTIEFAQLPVVGNYLKAIGWQPAIHIPDVVLWEKPYIALFSRWANEVDLTG